ncbi:MAG: hypothetical protein II821_08880 [Treponema sp.]|jgi:hypothetical protein|nr:hypothetical protein [Treponema sp.]
MTIIIDEKKLVQTVKHFAILLVIAAILTFLGLSSKIFHFSETNPVTYEMNYNRLSVPGKGVATSMKKTGEVQSKVLGPKRGKGNGGSKFFDEVEKVHGNSKK